MKTQVSYKTILALALPIILGSAVQNIIAVSDSVFLYHYSELDFQAISIASVFYLIISAIGFGFSRGGQILIARDHGRGDLLQIKKSFYTLLIFELTLAIPLFFLIYFFSEEILGIFINDQELIDRGSMYLRPRSWGIFFSYVGVGIVAFYTGTSKPKFIIIDTLFLAAINIVLNYVLIFGKWGAPAMGIAGAGWASALAEASAFFLFILYMVLERHPIVKGIFMRPVLDLKRFREIYQISINIVLQVIVGLGSWLIFFGIIENLGRKELAISNMIRIIYLILSIPTWGFSSAMNTISSYLLGEENVAEVVPATHRVMLINVSMTMVLTVPVLLFPDQLLYPLFGKSDMTLLYEAQPMFYLLILIMFLFSFGSVYFDSIIGMGKTRWGFHVKLFTSASYLMLLYYVVEYTELGLQAAWGTEIYYWLIVMLISLYFLFGTKWKARILENV